MPNVIAITGPESSGKTQLAKQLAAHYDTIWIPEYARNYLSDLARPYTLNDVEWIAARQESLVKAAAKKTNKPIFVDTETLMCYIWADYVFGEVPPSIMQRLQNQDFPLYLLSYPDLPWEPDPLREHPNERMELYALYEQMMQQMSWNFYTIKGLGDNRFQSALKVVDAYIKQI